MQQITRFRFLMKAPAHTLWVLFLSSFTFSLGYSSDLVISLLEKEKKKLKNYNSINSF